MYKILFLTLLLLPVFAKGNTQVEKYTVWEYQLKLPSVNNPFTDVKIDARFQFKNRFYYTEGFYDGENIYKVRFMPDEEGEWTYEIKNNTSKRIQKGTFICVKASPENHGPVKVCDKYNFSYSDGTPYYPFGTTAYAWIHQSTELREQTLNTLAHSCFNKIRMTVMPKNYDVYCKEDPLLYPFEGDRNKGFDFSRPNVAFFRHLDEQIIKLMNLGIEADLILFHPYDYGRWGFDKMTEQEGIRYIRYLVARIAAYRNVWWSLANEYDMLGYAPSTWEAYFNTIETYDPYKHLKSIHNALEMYDYSKAYVTHLSIQTPYLQDIQNWRETYQKPVIIDECIYEGNIPNDWGNLTPEEMVNRFWITVCRGGYCTHGETYLHPDNILWWAKGGKLYGKSEPRIAFLKKIIEEAPEKLTPFHNEWNKQYYLFKEDEYYLFYYGNTQQALARLELPSENLYTLEVIDGWNMTIDSLPGRYKGYTEIKLPQRPYIAVRAVKID